MDLIIYISEKIIDNTEKLTELDTKIGDSDHGLNMKRGFESVIGKEDDLRNKDSVADILKEVGKQLAFNVGGSAGPLFGSLFIEAGEISSNNDKFKIEELPLAVKEGLNSIQDKGNAEVGDKTMVDTLYPTSEYLNSVNNIKNKCLKVIKEMENNGELESVEQPTIKTDYLGIKKIKNKVKTPIMLDETIFNPKEAMNAIRLDIADSMNIKVCKVGGLFEAKKIANMAEVAGMKCTVGSNLELGLGIAASLHFDQYLIN